MMEALRKWVNALFGKNGFSEESHEIEVKRIKERRNFLNDETHANLGRMGKAYEDLDIPEAPASEPDCLDSDALDARGCAGP